MGAMNGHIQKWSALSKRHMGNGITKSFLSDGPLSQPHVNIVFVIINEKNINLLLLLRI